MAAAPAAEHKDPTNLEIRSTITAGSLQRHFGLPGAEDYRKHPNQRETELPDSIFAGMREKEVGPLQDLKVLKGTIYSLKNRRIITRWLRDVAAAFKLKTTTLCLAVQLTDCFLIKTLQNLPVSQCQLAAIASLWIAAKFEEMDDALPSTRSLVEVCAAAYTKEQILDMEEMVLESFRWKIPHVTVMNFLFLFLHMHTDPALVKSVAALAPVGADAVASAAAAAAMPAPAGLVEVAMITVSPASKARTTIKARLPVDKSLASGLPTLCSALGVPSGGPGVELYELFGTDLLVARRLDLKATPAEHRLTSRSQLFLSTSGAGAVFSERDDFSILRTMNGLLLHVCETLVQEVVVGVEFLRFNSHVTALAVLAVARCLAGKNPDEARTSLLFMKAALKVSLSTTHAAAQVLVEKYKEALEAGADQLPPPVIALPADIADRLAYIFGRPAVTATAAVGAADTASPKQ